MQLTSFVFAFDFSKESFRKIISFFQKFNRVTHSSRSDTDELGDPFSSERALCITLRLQQAYAILQKIRYTALGFTVNKFFVFKARKGKTLKESILFILLQLLLLGIANGLMWISIVLLGVNEAISWLLVSGIILLFNFAGMKFLIWKKGKMVPFYGTVYKSSLYDLIIPFPACESGAEREKRRVVVFASGKSGKSE